MAQFNHPVGAALPRIGLMSQDLQVGYPGGVVASDVVLSGFFGSGGICGYRQVPPADAAG